MFLPYSTDAPIYHWPLATGALILINTVAFIATLAAIYAGDFDTIEPLLLWFGRGLHPQQWVTANFLHADWLHLLGNMLGLWTFGLIVEGKIGWWRFLLVYLGLGALTLGITQVAGLGMDGGYGLGASGAVYALIGVALIWAPENDVHCVLFVWFRPFLFEMTVWAMSMIYFALQLTFMIFFRGLSMSSELIHMLGAVFGVAVGVWMLKKDWVDCENWDVFSVWAGKNTMTRDQRELDNAKKRAKQPPKDRAVERSHALKQMRELLAAGRLELVLRVHRKMTTTDAEWRLPEPDQRALIVGCLKQQKYADVVPLMQEYIEHFPDQSAVMRLKLAQILLEHERQPATARRVLAKASTSALDEAQMKIYLRLKQKAESMRDEGAFELQGDD